jgi:N-acetylneuraminic acid mutarotase
LKAATLAHAAAKEYVGSQRGMNSTQPGIGLRGPDVQKATHINFALSNIPREVKKRVLMVIGSVRINAVIKSVWLGLFVAGFAVSSVPASAARSGTWATTGNLITARSQHTATLLTNGKVLVAGGIGPSGTILQTAELYDPATGNWTATGSMATVRYAHIATLLPNGEVLVAGGVIKVVSNTVTCTQTAELYNPATGTWTTTGSMTKARGNHAASLLPNGQVLAAGGFCYNGSNYADYDNSSELYNSSTGTWQATASMNVGHAYAATTLLATGATLIAGGNILNSADERIAELYSNGQWTLTGNLNNYRASDTAALLSNGDVLVFGGGPLAGAELYSPTSGTWTNTNGFGIAPPVAGQTETLLATGMTLLAGGVDRYKSIDGSASLYNSKTNRWSRTNPMNHARQAHTATLLQRGLVLVAGGVSSSGTIGSAELYTP